MKINGKSFYLITTILVFSLLSFNLTGCEKSSKKNAGSKKTAAVKQTEKTVEKQIPFISSELADKNACNNAKLLMNYFVNEVYGKKIITGIMDCSWNNAVDMETKVVTDTGYEPALMGFDMTFMTKQDSSAWYNPDQVEKAINWWLNGGIVSMCWHWLDPSSDTGGESTYNTDKTEFRIPYDTETDTLLTDSKEFSYIKKDLDTIAERLDLMQQLGVVVLWRPMHEAKGNWGAGWAGANAWFWWGASGPKPYIALYKYMFDYLTNEKQLHNLIWVWNGQGKEWYPGDEYVDIVGYDIYDNQNRNGAGQSYYNDLMDWCNTSKMAAISEGGYVPSTEKLQASTANWLYYMIWNDDDNLADDTSDDNDNFWGGTKYNSLEARTTASFATDYQIKHDDAALTALFAQME